METMNRQQTGKLVEIHCAGTYYDKKSGGYIPCNKFLGMVELGAGYQLKCPRCGTINEREKNL